MAESKKLNFENYIKKDNKGSVVISQKPNTSIDFELQGNAITLSYEYSLYKSSILNVSTNPATLIIKFETDIIILHGYQLDKLHDALKKKRVEKVIETPFDSQGESDYETALVTQIDTDNTWLLEAFQLTSKTD